jgi:hypothetical protein
VRKLIVALIVVVGLLVAGDRIAVRYVDRAVGDRMREDGGLEVRPEVDIKGFPFLTQALRGSYDRTDVHIRDLTRRGVTVSRLDVTVRGAKIPLSKLGSASSVPVESLQATAVLTYYELASESGIAGLTVTPQGNRVLVTGKVAGVTARATSSVSLRGDRVVVTAQSVGAGGVRVPLGGVLDFSVRIPALPYGLELAAATAEPDGVHLTASTGLTVLTPQ